MKHALWFGFAGLLLAGAALRASFGACPRMRSWQKVYNERWMVGRNGHRSPAQVRRDHHALMQRMAA